MTSDNRPRRAGLSRDKILKKAVKLADRDGLDKLTMRALARGLGVEAMSLYNHVRGKHDLLAGLMDSVAGEIALPVPGGDWRAQMVARAHSAHAVLMAHPWAAGLFVSRPDPGPNMLTYVDATIGCLIKAGFSYPEADHAWNTMDAHIYGFTLQRLNFPFKPEDYADAARENLPMIPADVFPYLHGMAVEVAERRHDGIQSLDYGLTMILDGLEARLRA